MGSITERITKDLHTLEYQHKDLVVLVRRLTSFQFLPTCISRTPNNSCRTGIQVYHGTFCRVTVCCQVSLRQTSSKVSNRTLANPGVCRECDLFHSFVIRSAVHCADRQVGQEPPQGIFPRRFLSTGQFVASNRGTQPLLRGLFSSLRGDHGLGQAEDQVRLRNFGSLQYSEGSKKRLIAFASAFQGRTIIPTAGD